MSAEKLSFFEYLKERDSSLTDEEWRAHDERIRLQREQEAREDALRARDERNAWLIEEVGIPAKDLERIDDAGIVETKALRAVKEAVRDKHGIVVLSGNRGSGKTTAAAWWVAQNQPRQQYLTAHHQRFIDANALARFPRYDDGKMERLERALALVIDDLGVEYDDKQGNFRSLFDALVNARYASMLPTVITTNLNAEEFKARYGERVADRIREVGRFVSIAEESLRGRK